MQALKVEIERLKKEKATTSATVSADETAKAERVCSPSFITQDPGSS